MDVKDDERIARCTTLLPGWFATRMACDNWFFGFVLSTGERVHFSHIEDVRQGPDGSVWIDIELHVDQPISHPHARTPEYITAVAGDRTRATVNAAHVVLAFETQTG